MSIYDIRRKRELDHEPIGPPADVYTAPLRDEAASRAARVDWSSMRKAEPADYLLPTTRAWLEHLPVPTRPAQLAMHFPRIANMIALEWKLQISCRALLTERLIGNRHYRKGFPVDIHRELQALLELTYRGHLELQN